MKAIVPLRVGTQFNLNYQLVVAGFHGLQVLKEGTYFISHLYDDSIDLADRENHVYNNIFQAELGKFENY